MSEVIENMIDQIMQKNYAAANDAFKADMDSRIESALDRETTIIAGQVYNDHERVEIGLDGEVDVTEEFTDEDLEEFLEGLDQDDVNAICEAEEVESLDELSGAKLGQYMVKNRANYKKAEKDYDDTVMATGKLDKAKARKSSRTMQKRRHGENRAVDKLRGSSFTKVHAT